jgi:NAD(P)-dependent dehydrogenase (short-subunit alcohol dehydrogenase family)
MLEQEYDPIHAYARSKQALIVLNVALASEFGPRGVTVIALDPGTVDTRMAAGFTLGYDGMPPAQAGRLLGRMIADPGMSGSNGQLYSVGRRIAFPAQATDASFRSRLVDAVERQAGHRFTSGADRGS